MSVRLKLTLSYAGFLMLAGALLLGAVWVFLLRYVPEGVLSIPARDRTPGTFIPNRSDLLRAFAPRAALVWAFLLVFGLVGGWFLAGRMLTPLSRITEATRMAANGSLSHRIRLPLLLQMTTNLVHNAIVHSLPDQGTVWVATAAHPTTVELVVENTGDILAPQVVSRLAEPFQRGTERIRTDHAGVGLGLAIVKSIAQAHDGTLILTPRPTGGLRVTIRLPAAPSGTDR